MFEGEHVELGETIVDGSPSAHDILRLLGVSALASYIVNEVQEVYRLQGVKINDKHIEVIVRQMLRKAEIVGPGDSGLVPGEQIERSRVLGATRRLKPRARSRRCGDPVARHHEGVALDGQLHLRRVVPGDHPSAHRGVGERPGRRFARAQGERHRRAADPGGTGFAQHKEAEIEMDVEEEEDLKARFAEVEAGLARELASVAAAERHEAVR